MDLRALQYAVVVVFAAVLRAQDLSVLRAFHGFGDPSALAINAAETRAYVGESASVSVLDLTTLTVPLPPSAVLARVHVDASIVGLTLDESNQRLLVAGGSFGLCSLDLASAALPMTVHDDGEDLVCFEVALSASHVVAVFGAKDASELRIYDRSTLTPVGPAPVPLGTGTAFAVALDGVFAYVAMGIGGLVRVDLTHPASPTVSAGPVFPTGVFQEPARARDIAIADGRIYVAADSLGVVMTRTSLPWGPSLAYSSIALSGPTSAGVSVPMYAFRVAAVGSRVHVGATRVAGREHDGGPFTSFGSMSYSLAVGGVVTPQPVAAADAHVELQLVGGGLTHVQQAPTDGRWRELVARSGHVYGTHAFAGTFVRDAASVATVQAHYHGGANLPAEAITSLRDPDLALCGQDGVGDEYLGLLDLSNPDAIAPVPGTSALGSFGLWFDAQWLDSVNPNVEWFVGASADGWQLYRLDVTQPALTIGWPIPSPVSPDGDVGRNYWFSWLDGDLLLLTRGGTRWGLVAYSRSDLQAEAESLIQSPGTPLTTAEEWQAQTHFSAQLHQGQTWRCRTFSLPSGQRIAAIAAGFATGGFVATRAQVVLYDVSAGAAADPTLLARFYGPDLYGNAMTVVPHRVGATTYLFVGDFGYGIHVYDVSTPTAPVRVGGWHSGYNVFDGVVDHILDLELDVDDVTGNLYAYVCAWRRGLVRLEVTNVASISVVSEHDTPGLPHGVQRREVLGAERLLLADHLAGLRLYGEWATWTPFGSGCPGASGTLGLEVTSPPVLGGTLGLAANNLAGGAAVMVLGYTQLVPPLDLQPLGLGYGSGCLQFVTQDVVTPLVQSGGSATWSLPIPNQLALRGTHLYQQVLELATVSAVSHGGDAKID